MSGMQILMDRIQEVASGHLDLALTRVSDNTDEDE